MKKLIVIVAFAALMGTPALFAGGGCCGGTNSQAKACCPAQGSTEKSTATKDHGKNTASSSSQAPADSKIAQK
jgi:hypothetical protein